MNISLSNLKFTKLILILHLIINIVSGDVDTCKKRLHETCGHITIDPQICLIHMFHIVIVQELYCAVNYIESYKNYLASNVTFVNVEEMNIDNSTYIVEEESFLKPTLFCRTLHIKPSRNVIVRESDGKLVDSEFIDQAIDIDYNAPGNLYYPFPHDNTGVRTKALKCKNELEKIKIIDGMTHEEIFYQFYYSEDPYSLRKNSVSYQYRKHVIHSSKLKENTKNLYRFCNELQFVDPFKPRDYKDIIKYDSSVISDDKVEEWKFHLRNLCGKRIHSADDCLKSLFKNGNLTNITPNIQQMDYIMYMIRNIIFDFMLTPLLFCRSLITKTFKYTNVHKSNGRLIHYDTSEKDYYDRTYGVSIQHPQLNSDLNYIKIDYNSPNDLFYGVKKLKESDKEFIIDKRTICFNEIMSLPNFSNITTLHEIVLYFLSNTICTSIPFNSHIRKYRNHVILTSELRPGTYDVYRYSLSKSPNNWNKIRKFVRSGVPVGDDVPGEGGNDAPFRFDATVGNNDLIENDAPIGNDTPIGNNAPVEYNTQADYSGLDLYNTSDVYDATINFGAPSVVGTQADYSALDLYNTSDVYDATINLGAPSVDGIQSRYFAPNEYNTQVNNRSLTDSILLVDPLVGNDALVGNNTLSYNESAWYGDTHEYPAPSGNDTQGGYGALSGYNNSLGYGATDRYFAQSRNDGQGEFIGPEGFGALFGTGATDHYNNEGRDIQSRYVAPGEFGVLHDNSALGGFGATVGYSNQVGGDVQGGYKSSIGNIPPDVYEALVRSGTVSGYNTPPYNDPGSSSRNYNIENSSNYNFSRDFN